MILSSALPRLRQACSTLFERRWARYSPRDVRALLAPAAGELHEGRRAVLATAAVPGAWLDHLGKREAHELGRLADRLPTVVFLHVSGASLQEILRRVGGWSTWSVERALDVAANCIAARLNE